jgi:hypothetical protein
MLCEHLPGLARMSDPNEVRRAAIIQLLRVCESHAAAGRFGELRDEVATNPLLGFTEQRLEQMLQLAIATKSELLAAAILDLGLDVNRNDDGFTLLMTAIDASDDDPVMVTLLLDHGADLQARGINDFTPLHRAASWGFVRVVLCLLDRGAQIDARTRIDDYSTPLIVAAQAGKREVVELLLKRGADPREYGELNDDAVAGSGSREQQIERLLMRYRHPLGIRKPKVPKLRWK